MAITKINDNTKFLEWKDITNAIIDAVGNLGGLTTTDKTSIVNAINELDSEIGILGTLTTTDQDSLVKAINEVDALVDVNIANILTIVNDIGNLGSLTTNDKSSLVNAVNEVDALVDTNITDIGAIESNIDSIETDIGTMGNLNTIATDLVEAINEVDAKVDPSLNQPYFENFENSRFSLDTGITVSAFNKGDLLNIHNSSAFAGGDQFIDDNSNNGGSAGSMGAEAVSLLTKLVANGRIEQRYGYEFIINNVTAGGGTSDVISFNSTDYYPFTKSNNMYLGSIGETITWSAYIKNSDATNDILIGNTNPNISTYIDGVLQGSPYEMPNSDGWVHIRQKILLTQEYTTIFPILSAQAGLSSIIQIALPTLYRANVTDVQLGVVK